MAKMCYKVIRLVQIGSFSFQAKVYVGKATDCIEVFNVMLVMNVVTLQKNPPYYAKNVSYFIRLMTVQNPAHVVFRK